MYMYYFLGFQLAGENGTREVIFIEDNKEERRKTKDEQKRAKELVDQQQLARRLDDYGTESFSGITI